MKNCSKRYSIVSLWTVEGLSLIHILAASAFNVPIKAVSIQWLSKHYDEIEEEPGMIVIDEAHHALCLLYTSLDYQSKQDNFYLLIENIQKK